MRSRTGWAVMLATVFLVSSAQASAQTKRVHRLEAWTTTNLYRVQANLDGRTRPRLNPRNKVDFLRTGQWVGIQCQTTGQKAYGSRIWDRVGGLYVPDKLLKTYTDGFLPRVRRCPAAKAPPAKPATGARYVALGDSYSSGTGTEDYSLDRRCYRGPRAYPAIVAGTLGLTKPDAFTFAACHGGMTGVGADVFGGAGSDRDVLAGQLRRIGTRTQLVTISIGGNDAGFADVAKACAKPEVPFQNTCTGTRRSKVALAQGFILHELPGRLRTVYALIAAAVPKTAKVVVVGYPYVLGGEDCNAGTFFSGGERREINKAGDMLADVTRTAAAARGFRFVDARGPFTGHDNCSASPWIRGLSGSLAGPSQESFHPNAAGHQAYASLVLGALR